MRFGITILTDLPWAEARPRWQAAEEMGFDHAWTYDHLVWGGLPDAPWTTATPVLVATTPAAPAATVTRAATRWSTTRSAVSTSMRRAASAKAAA